MKFIFKHEDPASVCRFVTIELEAECVTLTELESAFADFVRGCGFVKDYDLPSETLLGMLEDRLREEGSSNKVKLVKRRRHSKSCL